MGRVELVDVVGRVDYVGVVAVGRVDTVRILISGGLVGIVELFVRVDSVGIVGRVDVGGIVVIVELVGVVGRVDSDGRYDFILFRIDNINFAVFCLLIVSFNVTFFFVVIKEMYFMVCRYWFFSRVFFSFFVVVVSVKVFVNFRCNLFLVSFIFWYSFSNIL